MWYKEIMNNTNIHATDFPTANAHVSRLMCACGHPVDGFDPNAVGPFNCARCGNATHVEETGNARPEEIHGV